MLGCVATALCFAQSGETSTGTTLPGTGRPDKKPLTESLQYGDPVIPGVPPKKKDFARPNPERWQICSRSCWIGGNIIGVGYAWDQPADVPCGRRAIPDERVNYSMGYKDHDRIVIMDVGWTTANEIEC